MSFLSHKYRLDEPEPKPAPVRYVPSSVPVSPSPSSYLDEAYVGQTELLAEKPSEPVASEPVSPTEAYAEELVATSVSMALPAEKPSSPVVRAVEPAVEFTPSSRALDEAYSGQVAIIEPATFQARSPEERRLEAANVEAYWEYGGFASGLEEAKATARVGFESQIEAEKSRGVSLGVGADVIASWEREQRSVFEGAVSVWEVGERERFQSWKTASMMQVQRFGLLDEAYRGQAEVYAAPVAPQKLRTLAEYGETMGPVLQMYGTPTSLEPTSQEYFAAAPRMNMGWAEKAYQGSPLSAIDRWVEGYAGAVREAPKALPKDSPFMGVATVGAGLFAGIISGATSLVRPWTIPMNVGRLAEAVIVPERREALGRYIGENPLAFGSEVAGGVVGGWAAGRILAEPIGYVKMKLGVGKGQVSTVQEAKLEVFDTDEGPTWRLTPRVGREKTPMKQIQAMQEEGAFKTPKGDVLATTSQLDEGVTSQAAVRMKLSSEQMQAVQAGKVITGKGRPPLEAVAFKEVPDEFAGHLVDVGTEFKEVGITASSRLGQKPTITVEFDEFGRPVGRIAEAGLGAELGQAKDYVYFSSKTGHGMLEEYGMGPLTREITMARGKPVGVSEKFSEYISVLGEEKTGPWYMMGDEGLELKGGFPLGLKGGEYQLSVKGVGVKTVPALSGGDLGGGLGGAGKGVGLSGGGGADALQQSAQELARLSSVSPIMAASVGQSAAPRIGAVFGVAEAAGVAVRPVMAQGGMPSQRQLSSLVAPPSFQVQSFAVDVGELQSIPTEYPVGSVEHLVPQLMRVPPVQGSRRISPLLQGGPSTLEAPRIEPIVSPVPAYDTWVGPYPVQKPRYDFTPPSPPIVEPKPTPTPVTAVPVPFQFRYPPPADLPMGAPSGGGGEQPRGRSRWGGWFERRKPIMSPEEMALFGFGLRGKRGKKRGG